MYEMTRSLTRSQSRSVSPFECGSRTATAKKEKKRKHKSKSFDSDKDRRSRTRSRSRSRSKTKSKKRKHRDRSVSRSRSRSRSRRRSRSASKKHKGRSRSRSRNRDRTRTHKRSYSDAADRSKRSRSHSRKYDDICDSSDSCSRNDQPSRTLMLSNIPLSITQKDIYDEIVSCKLNPRDIRLIKRKESTESRGFAFIDFESVDDATEFLEMKNGVLMLGEHSKSYLQFSATKATAAAAAAAEQRTAKLATADWICISCNEYNFKRRDYCFQCGTSRIDTELFGGDDTLHEISAYPTRTVMLRNLDVLTVRDTIGERLRHVLADKFALIANIVLSKDPLTGQSRGICYLQMRNVFESVAVFNVLMVTPFAIDNRPISVTYGTFECGPISEPVENFINFGTVSDQCVYSTSDLQYLAECSALKYAKTSAEFDHYLDYYRKFFAEKISRGEINNVSRHKPVAAAAAAATAVAAAEAASSSTLTVPDQKDIPTGNDNKKYTKPDRNRFRYDDSTGYHYDPVTGLYFDSVKNLYYNGFLQRYMYWDDGNLTYVHVPNHETDAKAKKTDKKTKSSGFDAGDKVKVAKKITKDLEKWAKSLNQKKEQFNRSLVAPVATPVAAAASGPNESPLMSRTVAKQELLDSSVPLTDSIDEMGIDWNKLVCLICQRQFSSKELLNKHQLLSELHKTNLQNYLRRGDSGEESAVITTPTTTPTTTPKYRDRAKERRMKFGESEPPPESKYLSRLQRMEPVAAAAASNSSSSMDNLANNVGSKMLQKMGWTEGQGLGKQNQGRTSIVKADGRRSLAGLGSKFSIATSSGESYVESAKKVMYARYSNLDESE